MHNESGAFQEELVCVIAHDFSEALVLKHMACAGCRACNAREHCQIVSYELQGLQCAYEASHSCSNMMASLPKTKIFSIFQLYCLAYNYQINIALDCSVK